MKLSGKIVIKNTFLNIVGEGLPSLAGIVVLPFLIRFMGQDRFGLLMLIFAIQGYMQFLNFRLGYALTKFAAEAIYKCEDSRLSQLTWMTISFLFIMGIIGSLITIMLVVFITVFKIPEYMWYEAKLSLVLTSFSVPLIFINTGWRAILAAGQRFDLINLINATTGCLRYIGALFLAFKDFHLPTIIIYLSLIDALRFGIYTILCLGLYPSIRKFSFNTKVSRSLLWFGGWLSVSQIVGMTIHYADRFIISGILPISQLTFYSAPSEVINRLGLVSQGLDRAIFPALSAKARSKETLQLYARAMKFMLVSMAPLTLIMFFFSHDLLKLYLGEEIAKESYQVFQWLILGFFISVLGAIIHNYVLALGYPDKVAKFHLCELPLYLIISIPLTYKFGIEGTSMAWFIRRILETAYVFFVLQRVLPENLTILESNGMNKALIAVMALITFYMPICFILERSIAIISYIFGIIGYLLLSWLFVFTQEERISISGVIKKFF